MLLCFVVVFYCIVLFCISEELCASDPAFGMSYLAHAILFVHNLHQNGNEEQKRRFLPSACAGTTIGGMCMSEPGTLLILI